MGIYNVRLHVEGTESDAISLRKSLAQSVSEEYELKRVFGVSVEPETLQDNLVMALFMVELEDGLCVEQMNMLAALLSTGKRYMTIDFHDNSTSAYGFVEAEYFQSHNYSPEQLSKTVNAILDDMNLENTDGIYATRDGRLFFMGYLNGGRCDGKR